MRFAAVFLFLGAAYAQFPCSGNVESNCTAANNCTWYPGSCQSKVGALCNTSSTTCSGSGCAAGPDVTNSMTCSKCTDACYIHKDNATCSASGNCGFLSGCYPTYFDPCRSATTSAACAATASCMWLEYAYTECGELHTQSMCRTCNKEVALKFTYAGFKSKVGSTCTWPSGYGYVSAFSVDIKAFAINSQCSPLPNLTLAESDNATQAWADGYFSASKPNTTMVCTATANGNAAGSLLPSLALLALAAALA